MFSWRGCYAAGPKTLIEVLGSSTFWVPSTF